VRGYDTAAAARDLRDDEGGVRGIEARREGA
jgi:hypothetical protein